MMASNVVCFRKPVLQTPAAPENLDDLTPAERMELILSLSTRVVLELEKMLYAVQSMHELSVADQKVIPPGVVRR